MIDGSSIRIRPFRDERDFVGQYEVWIRATEALPLAWRSSLTNVRGFGSHVPTLPAARLFAESGGEIVGYIGVNEVMPWEGLGQVLPFGFPWTWPLDEWTEAELYSQMLASLPTLFPMSRIDAIVQRFRRSWVRQHVFLRERGWTEHAIAPIVARAVGTPGVPSLRTRRFRRGEEATLASAIALDAVMPAMDVSVLRRRFDAGWFDAETTWIAPDDGAFQFEMRSGRAEVKLFRARPESFDILLDELTVRVNDVGASVMYFTLGPDQSTRLDELEARGFARADEDVYLVHTRR